MKLKVVLTVYFALLVGSVALAQLNISSPFFNAGVLVPAAEGGAFSPDDVSGLFFWVKADSITADDGDAIATWTDSSGNGYDCSQTTEANKPLFTNSTSTFNGQPTLFFDGVNDSMDITGSFTNGTVATNYTLFIVDMPRGSSDQVSYDSFTPRTLLKSFGASGNVQYFTAGTYKTFGAAPLPAIGHITTYVLEATDLGLVYTNGVAAGSTAAYAKQTLGGDSEIGARYDGASAWYKHALAEIVYYNGVLSTSDQESVEDYLADKYGITISR